MLSFLSKRSQKSVKREYYARVFVLFLGIICFLMIYSISAIIPAHTLSISEKSKLMQEIQSINPETSNCVRNGDNCIDPSLQVKSTNLLLNALKDENRTFVSVPLLDVLNNKNIGIKVTSIKYLGEASGYYKFSINGFSENRERLLDFSNSLKQDVRFSGISLPISDFVKSTDINFVLMINVKK